MTTIFAVASVYVFDTAQIPQERKWINFNESVFLVTNYLFVALNIVSVENNFKTGYALIIFLGAYMTLCIGIYAKNTFASLKLMCRKRYLTKAYKKERRFHKANL